jgi:aryl-alcohol dehydrogenase-like predicted oxidoreductase
MAEGTRTLVLDFVEWVAARPRTYTDVMDAWRTSCPRLTIWEDSVDQGLVARARQNGVAMVTVTALGRDLLTHEGRLSATSTSPAGGSDRHGR